MSAALPDLAQKNLDPAPLACLAAGDPGVLRMLLDGIAPGSKQADLRYNCFQALLRVAEEAPAVLLPHWDELADLLHAVAPAPKYNALYLLAELARSVPCERAETIFDDYFALLGDESVTIAAHAAGQAGKIALAFPELQGRITARLLAVEAVFPNPQRVDLVIGYVIDAFAAYYEQSDDRAEIEAFIRRAALSPSPATRKKARAFLKEWGLSPSQGGLSPSKGD